MPDDLAGRDAVVSVIDNEFPADRMHLVLNKVRFVVRDVRNRDEMS